MRAQALKIDAMRNNIVTEQLLQDFVFEDRRLEEHPKVCAAVFVALKGHCLKIQAQSPKDSPLAFPGDIQVPFGHGLLGLVLVKRQYVNVNRIDQFVCSHPQWISGSRQIRNLQSFLGVPMLAGGLSGRSFFIQF